MPELPDVAAYISAREPRIIGKPLERVRVASIFLVRTADPPLASAAGREILAAGGNAFDAVIQALKHANIPVAGADRLKLTEHIAIIDLMNLADALLLPGDDLALAVALKSPLFGLNDDDLFKLAWQRRGTLREALRQAEDTAEIIIQLHPDDLALLRQHNSPVLEGLPETGPLRFIGSAEVTRGGCIVQTRFGLVDARRETKMEQLRTVLAT